MSVIEPHVLFSGSRCRSQQTDLSLSFKPEWQQGNDLLLCDFSSIYSRDTRRGFGLTKPLRTDRFPNPYQASYDKNRSPTLLVPYTSLFHGQYSRYRICNGKMHVNCP